MLTGVNTHRHKWDPRVPIQLAHTVLLRQTSTYTIQPPISLVTESQVLPSTTSVLAAPQYSEPYPLYSSWPQTFAAVWM